LARMRYLGIAALVLMACQAPIQHGLDESAANELLSALERGGVGATKGKSEGGEGFAVSVAKGDIARALELMRSQGLPRGRRAGFGETYKQASLVPTATEERARFVDALTGELERTLEVVDGVVSARVHLVLPEMDPMSMDPKPRVPAQAAILIKARVGQPPPISEADVRKLVAGSVPSLAPEKVAVVVTPAPESPSVQGLGLVSLGPLRMSAGSRSIVLAGFGGVALILCVLAGLLIFMARRLAKAQAIRADEAA